MIFTGTRSEPAPPVDTVTCPDCEGEGEQHYNIARDENGVWTSDTSACIGCSGTGSVPDTDATVCTSCTVRTTWVGTHCPDHDDLCDEHRPGGCADCADLGGFDKDAYYAGRTA